MPYVLKLKTGFYETTLCHLLISDQGLQLVPIDDPARGTVRIDNEDLSAILLFQSKHTEIEIDTKNGLLTGIFDNSLDLKSLENELKEKIKTTIIYKEA